MTSEKVNLAAAFARFQDRWSPKTTLNTGHARNERAVAEPERV